MSRDLNGSGRQFVPAAPGWRYGYFQLRRIDPVSDDQRCTFSAEARLDDVAFWSVTSEGVATPVGKLEAPGRSALTPWEPGHVQYFDIRDVILGPSEVIDLDHELVTFQNAILRACRTAFDCVAVELAVPVWNNLPEGELRGWLLNLASWMITENGPSEAEIQGQLVELFRDDPEVRALLTAAVNPFDVT